MSTNRYRSIGLSSLLASLFLTIWLVSPALGQGAAKPAALNATEKETLSKVQAETITQVTTALSSDEMEGRGTGTPGGEKAAQYIADRFAKLGLKPLGDQNSFLQAIRFRTTQIDPESSIKIGESPLKLGEDFVPAPPFTTELMKSDGKLVFVGYGVSVNDLKRDDLAGVDIKGKIVVLIGGHPKNIDEETWQRSVSPQMVVSNLILHGAAGVMITNFSMRVGSFSIISDYLMRRGVNLVDAPTPPIPLPPIVLMSNEAAKKIFAAENQDFDKLLAAAENGETVSRELTQTAQIAIKIKKETVTGNNVVAELEGADEKLKKEAVVFTAHYDAFGIGPNHQIYHGAADNALGVAEMIAVAEALAKSPNKPRRSIIFIAFTGEEAGSLGAEYWVEHPSWPLTQLAADINFDGIGTEVYGPVKKLVGFGAEYSELGQTLTDAATANETTVIPDPVPEEQAFYRSDHFNFVRFGVPAIMIMGGPDGDQTVWVNRAKKWMSTDYHQPGDTIKPDWDWQGPRKLASVGLLMGLRVANGDVMPDWLPSSPFKHPRGEKQN